MSDPTQTTTAAPKEDLKTPNRSLGAALTALLGIVALVAIAFLANFLVRSWAPLNRGIDLTEDKVFTLSDGTKNILADIPVINDSEGNAIPVEIRYYFTRDNDRLSDSSKVHDRAVRNLLDRYEGVGKGKVDVKYINPVEDSDEEDEAMTDGISGSPDGVRHGLAVSYLEQKVAIPFLSPERDTLLEYDISRAITEVTRDEKTTLGLVSGLPIAGSPMAMMPPQFGGGGPPPWVVHNELSQSYEIRDFGTSLKEVDPSVSTLIVVHPVNLSDETLFAIDQYLLGGGNIIACLDPHSVMAQMLAQQPQQNPMMRQQQPPAETQSSLDKLLDAWGVSFSKDVIADRNNMTPLRDGRSMLSLITLGPDAVDPDDTLTSQLSDMLMVLPGTFSGTGKEGLEYTALITSSENSMMVNPGDAEENSPSMVNTFTADGTSKPIAIRLRGNFTTAFEGGKPGPPEPPKVEGAEGEEAAEGKEKDADAAALTTSTKPGNVILVGDVDWLHDQFTVQQYNVMGGGPPISIPVNQNLSFFFNAIDQLGGDENLISVRSRASARRPFGKINVMEAAADQNMRAQEEEFKKKSEKSLARINEIQEQRGDDSTSTVFLTQEQKEELDKLKEELEATNKKRRETRKELRKDVTLLKRKIKVANIVIVPIIVAFIGIGVAAFRFLRNSASS